ncbi:DMT family transporter [Cohnella sp. REN36]|uniref:DMT family transporter n=1 Tax=Cohnella sp. REN36 TaxID=2887347 RepID=UPI001D150781|nr:DMT family transporter [Cohnella sp. REN36]MCC3377499.1 DMT family transporter [Cohnella sp. REN36]
MIWFGYAILSALVFGLAGLLMKVSQMRGGALSSLMLGLYAAGTCGFWAQALLAKSWQPFDGRVWIAGAIIGLGSAWGNLLFMRALDYGPASLTSPLANGNIVFVMAMGAIWFEEPIHSAALAGAACLILGIVLLSVRPRHGAAPQTIVYRRWYPLVVGAMVLFVFRNGGLKVTDSLGLDNTSVLWAGYLQSWLWFAAAAGRASRRGSARAGAGGPTVEHREPGDRAQLAEQPWEHQEPGDRARLAAQPWEHREPGDRVRLAARAVHPRQPTAGRSAGVIGLGWGLAAGVCSYGGLQLYAHALSLGPSYLIAPIFAANSLVVVVGSLLIYREQLSVPQRYALYLSQESGHNFYATRCW